MSKYTRCLPKDYQIYTNIANSDTQNRPGVNRGGTLVWFFPKTIANTSNGLYISGVVQFGAQAAHAGWDCLALISNEIIAPHMMAELFVVQHLPFMGRQHIEQIKFPAC